MTKPLPNNQPDRLTIGRMILRFVLSLTFLGAVVAGNYVLTEQRIAATKLISDVTNNMAQQRMLAQRIVLLARSLVDSPYKNARVVYRKEIENLAQAWDETHEDLIRGELSEKLPEKTLKKVRSVYLDKPFMLEKDIKQFISSAQSLAETPDE